MRTISILINAMFPFGGSSLDKAQLIIYVRECTRCLTSNTVKAKRIPDSLIGSKTYFIIKKKYIVCTNRENGSNPRSIRKNA